MQNNTFDKIVGKLGFNPLDYHPERTDCIRDDYRSPFCVLEIGELRFLLNYMKDHKNKKAVV